VAKLAEYPKLYRSGHVAGTLEMIVRRNHVVVYAEDARAVSILRVLHAAQQWPPTKSSDHMSKLPRMPISSISNKTEIPAKVVRCF
jgi:hypothetical protein